MTVGDIIRRTATEKGITPYRIAKSAGVSNSYLSDLLRNKRSNPSVDVLKKIAEALEVPIDDLIPKP